MTAGGPAGSVNKALLEHSKTQQFMYLWLLLCSTDQAESLQQRPCVPQSLLTIFLLTISTIYMLSQAEHIPSKVGFSVGQFCFSWNIWQCPETFLVKIIVGVGGSLLTSSE